MKIIVKIIVIVTLVFGIFTFYTTVRNFITLKITEEIITKGEVFKGVVIQSEKDLEDEITIQVNDTTILKEVVPSDNNYRVGDTIELYNLNKYKDDYVSKKDRMDNLAIYAGLLMTLLLLTPTIIYIIKRIRT